MIRHRHMVLMSASLGMFTYGGMNSATMRMLVALMDTFRTNRAEAGLVMSTMMAIRGFLSPFCGMFLQKFGARVTCFIGSLVLAVSFCVSFFATSVIFLIVTLGIFGGIGFSLMFVAYTPNLCEHFKDRALAHALTFMETCGSFGGMAYSYITGYFIDRYGVRGTCLLIGGLIMNAAAITLLWNRRHSASKIERSKHGSPSMSQQPQMQQHVPQELESKGHHSANVIGNPSAKQYTPREIDIGASVSINAERNAPKQQTFRGKSPNSLKEIFKSVLTSKIFMLFALGESVHMAVMMNARTYIVDTINVDSMLNEDQQLQYGSLVVFLFGLFNLFGKLLFAIIKQLSRCSTLDVSLLSTVFGITGSLLVAFVQSLTARLVAWCLLGLAMGIYQTLLSVMPAKLLGKQRVAIGLGLLLFIRSSLGTVGGPLNGYIRDVTGTYTAVFICTSLLLALGGILVFIARFNRLKQKRAASTISSL